MNKLKISFKSLKSSYLLVLSITLWGENIKLNFYHNELCSSQSKQYARCGAANKKRAFCGPV